LLGSEDLARRVLTLAPPRRPQSDIRLLVGGDGVREATAADVRRGIPSRVIPIVLAPGTLGYAWRATGDALERTLATGPDLALSGSTPDRYPVTYLDATPIGAGETRTVTLTSEREWALLTPSGGAAVEIEPAAGLVLDAVLLGEHDADAWIRLDDASAAGAAVRLELPASGEVALVLHLGLGRGEARVRVVASDVRFAARGGAPRWRALLADDGEPDSYWGQITSPADVLAKRLRLPIDPETITRARIVYRVGNEPYHRPTRVHAPAPDLDWSDLVIELNGREVGRAPLDVAGREGWHRAEVPPDALVPGENEIRFRVDGPDYLYLAVDTDTHAGQSGVVRGGVMDPTSLRPGRVLEGEYLVRLEIR
jgi:hypothetical protein